MKKILITLLLITSAAGFAFAAEVSTEAKLQYNQGVDYYKLGRYEAAMSAFKQAIAIDPNYTDAYYNLGSILEYMKQDDAALTVFKQIIVRNPSDYESVFKAANLSFKLGKTDAAKKYLTIIPPSSLVYSKAQQLANVMNTDMQTLRAQDQAAKKAATIIPQTNGVYSNLGSPTGITSDVNGNLYIAAFADNAIYKISPSGEKKLYVKDSRVNGPIGLAMDSQGNLYVANYNADNVLKITSAGTISALISNVKKPYCLYVKGSLLFISSQGTDSVLRYKL